MHFQLVARPSQTYWTAVKIVILISAIAVSAAGGGVYYYTMHQPQASSNAECTNGTTNYPSCNVCPSGLRFANGTCYTECGHGPTNPQNCGPTPDFTINASPTSLFLAPRYVGQSTLDLAGIDGFSGPVSLTSGAPPFMSTSFCDPTPYVSSEPVTSCLSIDVGANAPCGATYRINATATNSPLELAHLISVSVTVPC